MKNREIKKFKCLKFLDGRWKEEEVSVPNEVELKIFLNSKKFVNILCTPVDIENLIIGFLFVEGIIEKYEDIKEIDIDEENFKVSITIDKELNFSKDELTYASGFGKGIIFRKVGKVVNTDLKIKPMEILQLMEKFQNCGKIYKISGAVHASCLASNEKIITIKEDIGRHNTVDKIIGECVKKNINTEDKIIFTTGRISTEMLIKSSRIKIPVVITKKSPTAKAVELAKQLGITIVGKVRDNSFIVFSKKERIMEA